MPFVALFFLATLIAFPLGILVILVYGILFIFALFFSPAIFGTWLWQVVMRVPEAPLTWQTTLFGVVFLLLVSTVPFFGHAIVFIVFLLSLGSISHLAYRAVWPKKESAPDSESEVEEQTEPHDDSSSQEGI